MCVRAVLASISVTGKAQQSKRRPSEVEDGCVMTYCSVPDSFPSFPVPLKPSIMPETHVNEFFFAIRRVSWQGDVSSASDFV